MWHWDLCLLKVSPILKLHIGSLSAAPGSLWDRPVGNRCSLVRKPESSSKIGFKNGTKSKRLDIGAPRNDISEPSCALQAQNYLNRRTTPKLRHRLPPFPKHLKRLLRSRILTC